MSPRLIVKVCGLTGVEDARAALEAGADWIGFVVKGEGPRAIAPERARAIVRSLPMCVVVAVLDGPTPDQALAIAREVGALRVQLHRVDPAAWPAEFPLPAAFAVPVDAEGRLTRAEPRPQHLLLLDTADARLAGGTGRTFPWETAATLARRRDVLLAGGLGPDNVADAVARVRPFGVDASSRLEISPGVKDPERVRRFVAAVRAADELPEA
jgi:phosphoribosylanthranilate isomerase